MRSSSIAAVKPLDDRIHAASPLTAFIVSAFIFLVAVRHAVPATIRIANPLLGLGAIIFLITLREYRRIYNLRVSASISALLLFAVFLALTFLWAPSTTSMLVIPSLATLVVVPVLLVYSSTSILGGLRTATSSYVFGAAVVAWIIVVRFINDGMPEQRYSLEGGSLNQTAFSLGLALVLLIYYSPSTTSRRVKLARAVVFGFPLVVAVLLSGSRGTVLPLLASLLAFAATGPVSRSHILRTIRLLCIHALVVLVGFAYLSSNLTDRYASIVEGDGGVRTNQWRIGWSAFSDAPFVGSGIGGSNAVLASHAGVSGGYGSHGTHVELLVESGVVGLSLFAIVVILVVRSARHISRDSRPIAYALLAYVLVGMLSRNVLRSPEIWFALGFVLGLAERSVRGAPEVGDTKPLKPSEVR